MTSTALPGPAIPATTKPHRLRLSIGGLAAEAAAALWDAERWEVPRPCYVTVSSTQSLDFQFADDKASFSALVQWLDAFGGTIAIKDIRREDGTPARLCRVRFTYHGVAAEAYAVVTLEAATT
jgi:hypothetical protein